MSPTDHRKPLARKPKAAGKAVHAARAALQAPPVAPGLARTTPADSLLEMARVLIADVGIEGLNMRDLAAVSGSSLRTLYGHFGSKDRLLAMVVADTFEGLVDPVHNSQPKNLSAVDQLVQLMHSLVEIALTRTSYVKVIMGIYHKHDSNREVPTVIYSMMRERIEACVDEFCAGRPIPPAERALLTEEATDHVFSVVLKWTLKMMPDGQLVHRLIYSTLNGLVRDASPAQRREIERHIGASLKYLRRV